MIIKHKDTRMIAVIPPNPFDPNGLALEDYRNNQFMEFVDQIPLFPGYDLLDTMEILDDRWTEFETFLSTRSVASIGHDYHKNGTEKHAVYMKDLQDFLQGASNASNTPS